MFQILYNTMLLDNMAHVCTVAKRCVSGLQATCRQSNGHVTDDVTWPNMLGPNISKTCNRRCYIFKQLAPSLLNAGSPVIS